MPETIEEITADRDEWREQHENLLSVKEQDNKALIADRDKLVTALGEIINAADALYNENTDGNLRENIEYIFNTAAEAYGITRRLPDDDPVDEE